MIRKVIRRIGILLAVLIVTSASSLPAYADWEQGINILPLSSAASEKPQSGDSSDAFVEEVIRLINAERVNKSVEDLKEMKELSGAANIRAQESAFLFSHNRPDGRSCSTVYSDSGLTYCTIGENLAYGFNTPSDLVKAWMNSKPHRENLLNSHFVYTEVGIFKNEDGVRYYSLLLYTPQALTK